MVQSLEHRMTDIEYIIAHLPDDLNARFAGVDVKMATIRETQLLHTQRFSTIERKIDSLESRMDGLDSRMEGLESRMCGLESRIDNLDSRMERLDAKVDRLDTKVDLILARLPTS